jgi:predicted TIM-barrel fold metal-dependent hydrolase
MIIDAHTHLGYDYVFEEDNTLNDLLTNREKNKIDISIMQPGTVIDLETVVKQHNEISALSKKMPGKIYGMANPNPHLPGNGHRKELERCIKTLGFVGVKLHPLGHAVNPTQATAKKVFEAASNLDIPVMVHTGDGIPWTLPSTLIPVAMKFPDLKIVLAHCGGGMFSSEAALAAMLCPNVYLETSWLPSLVIRDFCRNIGADRVMFGSDMGDNAASELAKFSTLGLTKEELEWCLWKTAAKVFKIPGD